MAAQKNRYLQMRHTMTYILLADHGGHERIHGHDIDEDMAIWFSQHVPTRINLTLYKLDKIGTG